MVTIGKRPVCETNHSEGAFTDDPIYLLLWLVKGLWLRYYNFIIPPKKRLVIGTIHQLHIDEAVPFITKVEDNINNKKQQQKQTSEIFLAQATSYILLVKT